MPLYEYECECGKKLEALKSIGSRYDVICECGKVPELKVRPSMVRSATYFTTIGCDGTAIGRRQTTERTPYTYQTPDGAERRL